MSIVEWIGWAVIVAAAIVALAALSAAWSAVSFRAGRWGHMRLNERGDHLSFGRGLLPWAHVTYGSVIKRSTYGLTMGHAVARMLRWYRRQDRTESRLPSGRWDR